MGRRKKGQEETTATLKPRNTEEEDDESSPANSMEEEEDGGGNGKFFACYLLTSLSPRFKGHTYIGFTVNPKRRIRQHNGELRSGAWRTKRRRPWEMVLCIYGFPTNVAALQFDLNLTVNYFSTKYMAHAASCPRLPGQMRVRVCSMDELPCYTGISFCDDENDDIYCEDGGCEESGGSQESIEGEFVEAQVPNDVTVVLGALESDQHDGDKKKAGSKKRTAQKRTKNTRLGKKLSQGSSEHDKKSDQEQAFSFVSRNEITADAQDSEILSLSDELLTQPKKGGVRGEEIHKQSFQLNGYSFKALSSSASSHNKMIEFAEDPEIFRSHDDLIRYRENEVEKEQCQPSLFVSCGSKIASIAEQKERIFQLLDECIDEHDLAEDEQTSESTFHHKVQCASMSSEVEVIDVFTPSPGYNATKGSKRRRRSETEIIDLTISPLVV
ncbi:OLC1v1006411C1 [Oldenlandia corymbosa var. corymbosa]|uniref:OLC1v1006411C1 n=1 Tax=Oldenlandia corymbosa var. corymbosa TaxID=529605 RepID=A0AAV1DHF7_OLDCO|nr:OLC1v1006411C1 [Oldenlandia corymbosa var. corymbosa]